MGSSWPSMPPKPISEAPKIRIPEDLLKKLDAEAKHFASGTKLSRIQMVSIAIREWLDARVAERKERS